LASLLPGQTHSRLIAALTIPRFADYGLKAQGYTVSISVQAKKNIKLQEMTLGILLIGSGMLAGDMSRLKK
jgi:hypothetical protein